MNNDNFCHPLPRQLRPWLLVVAVSAPLWLATAADVQTAGPLTMTTDPEAGRLTILHRDRPVLRYAFAADQWKPYVEELYSLRGKNVTIDSPPDHLHHHGLMYAITVNGINFWEEQTDPGVQKPVGFLARELHSAERGASTASFEQLIHWVAGTDRAKPDTGSVALLIEKRRLTVAIDESVGEVAVRWQSAFEVGPGSEQVRLSGPVYHGLGMRLPAAFDRVARRMNSAGLPYLPTGGNEATPSDWSAMTQSVGCQPLTVAMFGRPSNAGPSVFFSMLNTFAYLSATQALDQHPLVYQAGDRFQLDYLVTVSDRTQTAEELAERHARWLNQKQ